MKRIAAAVVAALLVTSLFAPAVATATATSQDGEAYAGTHVSFEADGNGVSDYRVDGDLFAENVAVESQNSYESHADVGAAIELSAVTNIQGSTTSLGAQTETRATIDVDGSAEMRSHDNDHGHLIVDAGGEDQYVEVQLGDNADTEQHSESRLTVEVEDDREGTFIVAGEGEVTTNEEGDVIADLDGDSQLVLRTYAEDRNEDDEQTEEYIADGTATAEAHVMERDGEIVHDGIEYGQETSVEAQQSAENEVEIVVERTTNEGTVLVTSVDDEAVGSVDDIEVYVDGEASVQAESYSELEGAIGSDETTYKVVSETAIDADANVLVGINHFSERTVSMSGDDVDEEDADDGADDETGAGDGEDDSVPGFGIGVALVALLSVAVLGRRRH